MAKRSIQVLIADDSILFRKIIRDTLSSELDFEVAGVARDGIDALEKIEYLQPDLVTLDLEMPGITGIDVLREISKRRLPTRVLVVSAMTLDGIETAQEMLGLGAFGYVVKSTGGSATENHENFKQAISEKLAEFRTLHNLSSSDAKEKSKHRPTGESEARSRRTVTAEQADSVGIAPAESQSHKRRRHLSAVVIGTSTGGPDALREFLPAIPGDFPLPILVVQHMPEMFTKSLADGLNEMCALNVSEAVEGEPVKPGRILIAAGGRHMRIRRTDGAIKVELTLDPLEHNCRPSVDYLFRSAVQVYGGGVLGIIMTGMGEDGAEGCRQIKGAGGSVIAQSEESCVVFGMPRLPVEEGIADSVVPLSELDDELLKFVPAEVCV